MQPTHQHIDIVAIEREARALRARVLRDAFAAFFSRRPAAAAPARTALRPA